MEQRKLLLKALFTISLIFVSPLSASSRSCEDSSKNVQTERSFWETLISCFSSTTAVDDEQAVVRFGNELCPEEQAACIKRHAKNKIALQNFTGQTIDDAAVPSIGIVCSGGGFRAAVATLGFLQGLEAIGLLDASTYLAALSGSTWSTASWMVHGYSLADLEVYLRQRMYHAFSYQQIDEDAIAQAILAKSKTGRPITLNDVWGGLIGNVFFGTDDTGGQDLYFSQLAQPIGQGDYPIPLFTNVLADTAPAYQWMEHSPFESGSADLNAWIPSSAFGKKFNNGVSVDQSAGETFAYMLGLCGSAYAASGYDAVNALRTAVEDKLKMSIATQWFSWVASTWFGEQRISPPKVDNFLQKIPGAQFSSSSTLTMVDAGVAINLPFVPLFRRNVEIYLVCDASDDCLEPTAHTMKLVTQYANALGLQLPAIDYKKLTTQPLTVIMDEKNPALPVIIYVPNFVTISTLDFDYSDKEFSSLVGGIKKALIDNAAQIKQALVTTIARNEAKHVVLSNHASDDHKTKVVEVSLKQSVAQERKAYAQDSNRSCAKKNNGKKKGLVKKGNGKKKKGWTSQLPA